MMESHIVRIYRCEKDNPRNFVGTVETVGFEEKKAFSTVDELWRILVPAERQRGGEEGMTEGRLE